MGGVESKCQFHHPDGDGDGDGDGRRMEETDSRFLFQPPSASLALLLTRIDWGAHSCREGWLDGWLMCP